MVVYGYILLEEQSTRSTSALVVRAILRHLGAKAPQYNAHLEKCSTLVAASTESDNPP